MTERRIDELRQLVADVGKRQAEYHRFFPGFAERVVECLGTYLGDLSVVALTVDEGDFSFDHQYGHEGLDFDQGFYRIPIMVRIDNLQDKGLTAVRFRLFCELGQDKVSVSIEGDSAFDVSRDHIDEGLCERIFQHLQERLSVDNFIDRHHQDYRSTSMGFGGRSAQ